MSDRRSVGRRLSRLGPMVVVVAASVGGCRQGLFDNSDATYRVAPERLQQIVRSEIVSESTTPPKTPEEAVREAIAKGDPIPEYPDRMDVALAEVRASTLRNNLEIRAVLVDPAIAQRRTDAERAKFEATFFADYTRNGNTLFTNALEGTGFDQDTTDLGVRIPFATGGEATLFSTFTRAPSALADAFDGGGDWQSQVGFSISQPLLRGAGINANTASIRIAEYNGEIVSARTKLNVIRILADSDRAYWNTYSAFRELEVRKQQYELAVAQRDRAQRRVNSGDAAEIEVIRAESGIGSTLEGIIVADAALRDRVRDLKRIMNRPDLPVESPTMLVPATSPNPLGITLEPETLVQRALDNRMELLELELQLAADATDIALARNQALPLFTLEYSYAPLGSGGTLGTSISNIGDFEQDNYTFTARGEIPIGNEAAKNRLAAAVLTRVQRLATKDARRQSIRTEVLAALNQLQTSWQRILAARLETLLASRTYEAEKRQFDVGLRTSQDVLDASTRLADAQSREVNALAQWQISLVDIAFATGTLLGESGIVWQPLDIDRLERMEHFEIPDAINADTDVE